jgi:hypothetical protein
MTSRFIPGQYKQDNGCKGKTSGSTWLTTSILSRPKLCPEFIEGRSEGRIEGCGLWQQEGPRISRTPFDGLRTGFDTLLHCVPQLLRMLR